MKKPYRCLVLVPVLAIAAQAQVADQIRRATICRFGRHLREVHDRSSR